MYSVDDLNNKRSEMISALTRKLNRKYRGITIDFIRDSSYTEMQMRYIVNVPQLDNKIIINYEYLDECRKLKKQSIKMIVNDYYDYFDYKISKMVEEPMGFNEEIE